jgi:CRISPR type III-A-associated RAMP protein Csm4
MILSMFIPNENEFKILNLVEARYDLILRGGFMAAAEDETNRHLWKKSIYMFNHGSIFKTTKRLIGKTVNLRPNWNDEKLHNIYRSGKAFCLPIKIGE